jgi:hypothetical protein
MAFLMTGESALPASRYTKPVHRSAASLNVARITAGV